MYSRLSAYFVFAMQLCADGAASCTTSHESFSWPQYPTLSFAGASPRPSDTGSPTTFAPPFPSLSVVYPNQSVTRWPSIQVPTDSADPYGNVAWSAMWSGWNITAPPITTTISPTPVASFELIKPTPLPFVEDVSVGDLKFTNGFLYGFAGAALQVEGAVESEGRGPTITELLLQNKYDGTDEGGTPDISTLNYYFYKQDIARLAAIGVQSYSFSISWTRILPFGVPGSPVNQEAIEHYDDLINTILDAGMEPLVTLHHFDTPLPYLTNTSSQGFDHPEFISAYLNYAKIVLTRFSDRVPRWISFNEPTIDSAVFKNWISSRNVVLAHSELVHWYREKLHGTGSWGLKVSFNSAGFSLPLDPSNDSHIVAAERLLDFNINYLSNPLVLGLQPPSSLMTTLGSRSPVYTDEELAAAKDTCDFYAFDIYTASYTIPTEDGIESCARNYTHLDFPYCVTSLNSRDGWRIGPQGDGTPSMMYQHFRTILGYLHSRYPTAQGLLISEYGFPTFEASQMALDSVRADFSQSIFFISVLQEVLKAVNDGVKVLGAIGWSYVDNWEWGQYHDRYGVQAFNSTTLERSYKRAIFDYVDFVQKHL